MSSQIVGGGNGAGSSTGGHHKKTRGGERYKDWWNNCIRHDFPDEEFRKQFHMSRKTFDFICNELYSVLVRKSIGNCVPVPVPAQVGIFVRRLATGESHKTISWKFGVSKTTVTHTLYEVYRNIENVLRPKFIQWPNEETLGKIKTEFQSLSGIHNVVGSLYTTHIPLAATNSINFNRLHKDRNKKDSYSIPIHGVVDHRGIFIDCYTGGHGSESEDQILEHSPIYQKFHALEGAWIVGSPVFPLMDGLLVPYTDHHQQLSWTQHAFNKRTFRIRTVALEAFTRLRGRWACLKKLTELQLHELPMMLGACCVLHNICEIQGDEFDDEEWALEMFDDEIVPERSVRSDNARRARDDIAADLVDSQYDALVSSRHSHN